MERGLLKSVVSKECNLDIRNIPRVEDLSFLDDTVVSSSSMSEAGCEGLTRFRGGLGVEAGRFGRDTIVELPRWSQGSFLGILMNLQETSLYLENFDGLRS